MNIIISSNYGFDHNWTLIIKSKSFYLGQDVKFCHRILGMSPRDIVQQIGSAHIQDEKVNKKLARFIVKQLGGIKAITNLQPWELCAE
jgi:hypothetical protein